MIPWKQPVWFFLTQRRNTWFRRYRIQQTQLQTHSSVTPSGPACALWLSGTNSANISRNHLVTAIVNTAVPSEDLSFFASFSHSPTVQWKKTPLECTKWPTPSAQPVFPFFSLGSWGGEMLSISRLDSGRLAKWGQAAAFTQGRYQSWWDPSCK